MNREFENKCNEYIAELVQDGEILFGYIVGCDENLRRSKAFFTFIEDGVAVEKKVMIFETGEEMDYILLVDAE